VSASERALALTQAAARAASDKKAENPVALDVSERMPLSDVFLIVSGNNERHVISIAEGIEEALGSHGDKAVRREGMRDGRWALMDFNDVLVHVMHDEDRVYYDLERLWKDCPVVGLPEDL
jgi:ribosome-associated protein